MKNGAGVACIPEIRAALRLKAFEAWPDAKSTVPVTGVKFGRTGLLATAANVVQTPTEARPRELGAGAVGGQATDALEMLCPRKGERGCK